MDKNDWSRLEGKKIIVFGCDLINRKRFEICVIMGCDPNIGICMGNVGAIDPWFIVLGHDAPNCPIKFKESSDWCAKRKLELESIYKQLQSGYYSAFADDVNMLKIWGELQCKTYNGPDCPFSL